MRIDILIKPNDKVDMVERVVRMAANMLKIKVEINKTRNFTQFSQCAINPTLTPIVIINGNVEFAGKKPPELDAVKRRLAEIAFR